MSMGLFSACGTAAEKPVYEITSPVFDEITIHLDKRYYPAVNSDKFIIRTYNNSDQNMYIGKARLNGKSLETFWFPHEAFANGGLLELWMSPNPNKKWGKKELPVR